MKTIVKSLLAPRKYFMQGNIACAEGALAAGCRYYAGYPITPSSEIMEHMSIRLPEVGGVFMQMEDEIASICSMIGASWAGAKVMTATSGPGFSLMLEGIGYAVMTETPCVIVDVQRAGPATGQATKPAQGDVMQARWGAHGDHRIIALSPWSVQEMYDLTIKAFNFSEKYRVPTILLADEVVAHLKESFVVKPEIEIYNRDKTLTETPFGTQEEDGVPPMPCFGQGAQLLVTGSTHNEYGIRKVADPDVQERLVTRLCKKIDNHKKDICLTERYFTDNAEYLFVAYGISARSSYAVVSELRESQINAGLLRYITIWPFDEETLKECALEAKVIFVPEMNQGQLVLEIMRILPHQKVIPIPKTRGEAIYPSDIIKVFRKYHE
ncbi:MAG: 2-oxoacid:acceptor oxidoreductase subunit alpha [candidate division WOR-3 bacterium]|nr:2-oxoacid:acceptor oxidoreductase subunit alpha [candidate division WOR-3 bacterium]MCX7757421.1 2-oxoacid:acceptor oxidoreductase subunit alpha [candidate division WOR-3 bacterium]MDW7988168.1 2-oxoacid:acceptor oxidoreductase subunit alpha [candidate division WOR-3 bacterium]